MFDAITGYHPVAHKSRNPDAIQSHDPFPLAGETLIRCLIFQVIGPTARITSHWEDDAISGHLPNHRDLFQSVLDPIMGHLPHRWAVSGNGTTESQDAFQSYEGFSNCCSIRQHRTPSQLGALQVSIRSFHRIRTQSLGNLPIKMHSDNGTPSQL